MDRYEVSAIGYLIRCQEILTRADTRSLFYAAFELRCALERTPFDFHLLVSETVERATGRVVHDWGD